MSAAFQTRTDSVGIDLASEANHRIANQLAVLASVVQAKAAAVSKGADLLRRSEVRGMLDDIAARVVALGHSHRRFSSQPGRGEIDLCDHLVQTASAVSGALGLGDRLSLVQSYSANCSVSADQAHQIGLMFNEIVMNAVKHAHPTGIPVQVQLSCRQESDGRITVEIADDGVGLPEDAGAQSEGSIGFALIRSLAKALDAELRIESDSLGLTFLITLPPVRRDSAVAAR